MGSKKFLIGIAIFVLLIAGFVFYRIDSKKIKSVSVDRIESIASKNVYTLFYAGDRSEEVEKLLKYYRDDYKVKVYYISNSIDDVKNKYDKNITSNQIYIMYDENNNKEVIADNKLEYVGEYIKKVIYNYVPTPERHYKLSTGAQYISMYNSKDTTIAVFAEDDCSYCNMLEPIINDVAKEIKEDIYYYNKDRMNEDEYTTIMSMDVKIPDECASKPNTSFKTDFAKPMTLVSKGGKVVGCIKGYFDHDVYLSYLKSILEG